MRKPRYAFWIAGGPALLLVAAAAIAIAGPVSTPNTFTPGTVADANEVNANFTVVATAINDNDSRCVSGRSDSGGGSVDSDHDSR